MMNEVDFHEWRANKHGLEHKKRGDLDELDELDDLLPSPSPAGSDADRPNPDAEQEALDRLHAEREELDRWLNEQEERELQSKLDEWDELATLDEFLIPVTERGKKPDGDFPQTVREKEQRRFSANDQPDPPSSPVVQAISRKESNLQGADDQPSLNLRQNSSTTGISFEQATVSGEKSVNFGTSKSGSKLSITVLSKQIAMAQTSILSCCPSNALITDKKAKTLLEKVLPKGYTFLPWDILDDTDKLMLATEPLLNKAAELGYECKPFTLILNKKLSNRLDEGEKAAPGYIRDQMVRQIRNELGPEAWFMYAIEKAPAPLSDGNSRRRWHLHGLMIGPTGFSAQRIAPIRRALRSLKGEARSDLMFSEPKEGFQSALRWSVYCAKNEMSVFEEPELKQHYDLLPGKATFICRPLLQQTREHYETAILPFA